MSVFEDAAGRSDGAMLKCIRRLSTCGALRIELDELGFVEFIEQCKTRVTALDKKTGWDECLNRGWVLLDGSILVARITAPQQASSSASSTPQAASA